MKKYTGFFEYVRAEVFDGIKEIRSVPMFGGWGFYFQNIFFGIIGDGKLYFKVTVSNKQDYIDAGMEPFRYTTTKGETVELSYWEVPIDVMEDKEKLRLWIDKSVAAKKQIKS